MNTKVMKTETVDKTMLSKQIARRIGLTITDVINIIDIFEDEIINSIKQNKKVQLNGFLVFEPRNVEGGKFYSALDKKEYEMKPKRIVLVRVGKYFKESIAESYVPTKGEEDDNYKESKRTTSKSKTNK